MKSKGKLFWARFLMLMALFVTTLFACVSLGTISARAEETGEGAALSEDGGVSVLALPENVTVTEITGVDLTGTVTTASSYADIKAALAVTARGSDGETYELDPDEFEVVGVFETGSSTSTFVVTCGEVTSQPFTIDGLTVTEGQPKTLSATFTNNGTTIYSYTNPQSIRSMLAVTASFWDGTTRTLSTSEWILEGNLLPERSGLNGTFEKAVTVRYNGGTAGTSDVTCECLIEDIHTASPTSILLSFNPPSVDANEDFAASHLTVQVIYSGGFATLEYPAYNVSYVDEEGNHIPVNSEEATGYIYINGGGYLYVSYAENGTTIDGTTYEFAVNKIPTDPVSFATDNSDYAYEVTEDTAEGQDQTISIANYIADIMEITSMTYNDSPVSSDQYSVANGTITVQEVGTYQVTVSLKEDADEYFFSGYPESQTSLTITYTVNHAPLNDLKAEFIDAEGGTVTEWERDDAIEISVSGNYGSGEVTYIFSGTSYDGSTVNYETKDPTNIPEASGEYSLSVRVPETDNFQGKTTESVDFRIGQRVLRLPTLNDPDVNDGNLVYNGVGQKASITYAGTNDATYLTVTNEGGTTVGGYKVVFEINANDNGSYEAVWDSSIVNGDGVTIDGNTLTLTYQITRLSIAIPTFGANGTITTPYDGSPNNGTAQKQQLEGWAPSAGFAEGVTSPVTVSIQGGSGAVSADSKNGTVTATNAGTYTIKVSLGDTDNLQWAGGTSVDDLGFSWTIDKATVTIPDAGSKTYTGGALTSDLADTDFYTVSQGTDWVNADDYDVKLTLTDATNYKWSDGREDESITVTFTIDPLPVTIVWDDSTFSFIYDGNSHVASASVGNIRSQNGVPDDVSFVISGEQTNANTDGTNYTATIIGLTGDQAGNYTLTGASGSTTQTFTIAPRSIGIVWGTTTNEYDGESWHPEAASFTNVIEGDSVGTLTYDGAQIDAGTNYTVMVTAVSNPNYTVSGGTNISTTFTITPRVLEGAWGTNTNVYSGGSWHPVFTPSNVLSRDTIALAYSGAQINAGTGYVAQIVEITGMGAGNYTLEGMANPTCGFEITRVQLTRPTEDTTTFTYTDGNQTYMPVGFDADTMDITGNVQMNANEAGYTVTVSIRDKVNYEWSTAVDGATQDDITFSFVINKAQVDVSEIVSEPDGISGNEASDDRRIPFTEEGTSHLIVTANPDRYSIGSRTTGNNVGDYEVILTLVDPDNYEWTGYIEAGAGVGIYDTVNGAEITIRYAITYQQFTLGIELAETWVYGNDVNNAPVVTNNLTETTPTFTYYTWDEDAQRFDEEGSSTLPTNVGRYLVVAEVEDGNNYAGTDARKEFTITPRTVTVEISVSDGTYGSWSGATIGDIVNNANSDYEQIEKTNISLIFESLTSGVELVNGIPQNAGEYSVTAQFATGANPNGNYTLAVAYTTDGAFTISPLALTVTGWDGTTNVYAGQGSSYQPAVNDANVQEKFGDTLEGLGLEYTVTANEGSSLSSSDLAVDVGKYTVKVTGIGNPNYTLDGATDIEQPFTITPYTIAFTITPQNTVYGSFMGDDDIRIDYTTTTIGGERAELSFSYEGRLNSGISYTDRFEAGSYTVTATIGNKNYQLADGVTAQQPFTIERYTITEVTWETYDDLTYRKADLYAEKNGVFASATGVYGDGTLDLTEAISGTATTFQNAGSYTFTAGLGLRGTQAYNYTLGSTFTEDYTITPAEISIEIVEKHATYRGTSYTADEVFTGGLGNSYTVSGSTFNVDLNKAVSFAIAENMNAGSYAVTMTFTDSNFTVSGWSGEAGDQSYTFENAFTIDPALLTPSFTTDGGVYGNIDATVAAGNGWSVEGLVNSEQQDVLGGSISYAGVDTSDVWSGASSPAGSYTITLTITNGNYTFQEGSFVLTFTADEHLVVEQHTITQVTWAEYSEDQLTYTGSDLYEALGEAFASAQGVNGDGTLQLGESIALASGGSADFINAGSYTFTATLGIWGDNYKFPEGTSFTQPYIIVNAGIIVSGVAGYADDYDGNAHDALVLGYTATTADRSEANWSFYEGGTAPEADSEAWGAMPEFTKAGTYTVWYKASAENHNDVINSVTVTIDKLAISVAIDGTITYGDALPAYTVGVDKDGAYESRLTSGSYAGSENFATLLSTGLTLTGISSDDYSQGDGIDTYNLTWTFSDEATNYIVTAVAGDLRVNRRAVTIKINDYTDGIYGKPPTAGQLTWERTAGSIYDDDVLFTLATTATASSDITTADRHYYIYPVLEEVADNYDITFTGSLTYTGNGYDGAAGEYVIHPAEVSIDISVPVEGLTYDGAAKEYSATSGKTTLTPVYYEYIGDEADWETNKSDLSYFEEIGSAPVEAGYYRVQFTSNNPNYTSGSSGTSFRIEPRTINVEIDIASGSYTGQQFVAKIAFGNVVADDLEAWQAGTDYTVTYTGRNTTVYDSQTAPVNVGSYTVTVAVLDGNYELTQIGSVSDFEIARAQLIITAENKTIVYGDALNSVTFTVNYSGFVNGETEAVLGGTLAFTTENEVGGAPYEQGDDAGSAYRIIPKGLTSDNYDIEFKEGALSVEERGVTVTIKDQTTTYTGVTAVLDQDAYEATNVYGGDDLVIALSTNGVDAGSYAIIASWSNNNYDVTFAGSWGDGNWGTLIIDPAPLTITAENKTIIYGDALTSVAFSVSYSGLVNDEQADEALGGTLAFATANTVGEAAYAQGDAAGSTYSITASGLTSGNYTIEWLTGTLTVEKRVVTVKVSVGGDGQYAFGDEIVAEVEFDNVYGLDSVAHKVYYKGTPNGGSTFDWTESVPTLAGEYLARVQITDSNYTFANDNAYSEDFSYNIAKRLLDVNWNELTIQYDSAVNEHSNYLVFTGFDGYSGDVDGLIAGVLTVGTQTAVGADASILQQATSRNGYVIRVNGAVATYTVVVTISGSNFNNYTFAEGDETTVSFEVSASVNTLEFAQDAELGWIYGEPAAWTEGTGLRDILSLTYGDVTQVIFSYAVRTENGTATGAVYTSVRPDDAGDYWVRAFYPGDVGQGFGSAVAYAEFTIAQATLQAPSLTHSETTYSGLEQDNAIVGFDAVTMGISTDVNFSTEGEGDGYTVVLHATDAGTYTVTITLKDSRNYVWADSSSSVLTWTVNAATGNRVTIPDGGPWTYGETITAPQATATFGEPTYQYAVLSEDFSGTDYSGVTGWASGFPTQAGRYVVRAIVRATSNYDGAVAYKEFRINPAQITVGDDVAGYTGTYDGTSHNARTAGTASTVDGSAVTWSYSLTGADGSWQTSQFAFRNATDGAVTVYYKVSAPNHEDAYGQFTVSIAKANLTVIVGSANITYGDTAPASYTLSYAGFVGSDTSSVVDASEAVFSCSYATGDDAGDYAVSVSGLTADNYTFNVIDGTLNVGRKPIAVGIGDQFSDYGETVVLDQTQWACNEQELIDGDTLADLGITLSTQAGQPGYTSAGTYAITGSAAAGNYEVSFIPGIYTIYARSLTVEITANGGIYGGTITGATAVLMENGQPVSYDDVSVILTYTGTANDGSTEYDNSLTVPDQAGAYTVTASLNNSNYTLTGVTSAAFLVERATVQIPEAGSKPYTGWALQSDLESNLIYVVEQGDSWVEAKEYEVWLTLNDTANYRWATTDDARVAVTFRITQGSNKFTAAPEIENWVYGEEPNAPGGAQALFGNDSIVYMYSTQEDGVYTTEIPVNADEYWVKAFIAETTNYAGAESEAVRFEVLRVQLTVPAFTDATSVYTGSTLSNAIAGFDAATMTIGAHEGLTVTDGVAYVTGTGEYTLVISITDTVNYEWADGTNGKVTLTWNVIASTLNTIEDLTIEPSWTYFETPGTPSANAVFGTVQYEYAAYDGETAYEDLTGWTDTMPTAAGLYVVRAYVEGTADYNYAEAYAQFEITPAEIEVRDVAGYSGVYDGDAHNARTAGTATTVDGSAVTWEYSLSGADGSWQTAQLTFTNATDGATVYYRVSALNHDSVVDTFTVSISKAGLTVIVGSATIDYGEEAPESFDVAYRGFVNGEDESVLGGTAVFEAIGYAAGSDIGTYTVNASGLTAGNYTISYESGTLYVRRIEATVTITAGGGVYGAVTSATARVEGLIASDDGVVNAILTYTGTANDGTRYNNSLQVPDRAGVYTVTATLSSDNYTLTGVTSATFVIQRATVELPDAGSKQYTGGPLQSDLKDTDLYTVRQGTDWIDVDEYDVTLTLEDDDNYRWATTDDASVTVIFRITQAGNRFTADPVIVGWTYSRYDEAVHAPYGAQALFGNDAIVYMYASSENGEYTTAVPVDADEYWVKAFIAETENYAGAQSGAVRFVVSAVTDNAVTGLTFAQSWVYFETPEAPAASAAFGTVQFVYAAYDGTTAYEELTDWSDVMPTAVGTYVICAYVDGTQNYNGDAVYAEFEITPAAITVRDVAGYTGTYDSTAHNARTAGSATTVDGIAVTWSYSRTGEEGSWQTAQFTFRDAGDYTVWYKVSAANHEDVIGSFTVSIAKADLTVVVGSATIDYGEEAPSSFDVTYRGFVGDEDERVLGGTLTFTVVGYTAGSPAGSYAVLASGYTSDNYNITYESGTLRVMRVTLTVTITAGGGVYGGEIVPATATLHGVPEGADVRPILTYTGYANDGTYYESTIVPVKAGSYTVTVTLSDDSYTLTGSVSAVFTIEKQLVYVPGPGSKPYTGKPMQSDLSDTAIYTVEQGDDWIDAGDYIVTLTLRDASNYRWGTANAAVATVTFRITQAQNVFIKDPVIDGWTYGGTPNAPGGAQALFGNDSIVYLYASSEDGAYAAAVPENAGTYWVKAFVAETANYTGAESAAVSFSITRYTGMTLPTLERDSSVYSGAEQVNRVLGFDAGTMEITGGASVTFVDGIPALRATDAGVYTITITFKDGNYTWADGTDSVTLTWTIGRLAVEKPTAAGGEWIADGSMLEYIPNGFDADVMEISGNRVQEAGRYTVTVTLRDTGNYVWSDGTDGPVTFTWRVEEEVISLLWLIILLAIIIAIEIVLLVIGIIRRNRSDDHDGPEEPGATGGASGTKVASVAAVPALAAVIAPMHATICWILGAVAVALLVAILVVYLKKKPEQGAEDGETGALASDVAPGKTASDVQADARSHDEGAGEVDSSAAEGRDGE